MRQDAVPEMLLECHPVTPDRWSDFEKLFEFKGSPHYCWCMLWRTNENKKTMPTKTGKKAAMQNRVEDGIPIGLLGYLEGEPVAWCSVAPRETYRSLGGDEKKDDVWSVTCFFVKRSIRKRGVPAKLLAAAIEYARSNGAQYIEGYPVAPDSPTYRYIGLIPMFESAGFQFIKSAGSRRNVMALTLK